MRDQTRATAITVSPVRSKGGVSTAITDPRRVANTTEMSERTARIMSSGGGSSGGYREGPGAVWGTPRRAIFSPAVDFRKTYYILPNLFTLSSVFCGFISISLSASSGTTGSDLYQAALAICFGFFFDTADGRVARLTKTQTDLGRDLDSLADVVTFGVAPGLLVYKWGLGSFGRWGILLAGLFVCAGAMRLARFNVLSRREDAQAAAGGGGAGHKPPGKYTLGLT